MACRMINVLPCTSSLLRGTVRLLLRSSPSSPSRSASSTTGEKLQSYASLHWDDSVTTAHPNVQRLYSALRDGSRSALAESITLVESSHPSRRAQGDRLLSLVTHDARSKYERDGAASMTFRVAISGSPGVGKSTFIEAMGMKLIKEHNKKVAILTVDPSSHTTSAQRVAAWQRGETATGGSILGDMTRMEQLSRQRNAFIRQSPSSGALGGVTRGTHEAIALCEAAGYEMVIVETVGVGQSEATVGDMCDMFILLLSPAHGDELQGIKRGIVEAADLLVVTKADGQLMSQAKMTQAEYMSALKYMRARDPSAWRPKVMRASSMTGDGLNDVWDMMQLFWQTMADNGHLHSSRVLQQRTCMLQHVQDGLLHLFATHPQVRHRMEEVHNGLDDGSMTAGQAADGLIRSFLNV